MNVELRDGIAGGIAFNQVFDNRQPTRRRVGNIWLALLGASLVLGGCGGGGNTPSAANVDPAAPLPAPAGAFPATELSGTWEFVGIHAGERSAYEFHADGTFSFYSRFTGVANIQEDGRYGIDGSEVTVVPARKLYNGELSTPGAVRTYEWRVEPDSIRGGRLLTLTLAGGIPNQYHGN